MFHRSISIAQSRDSSSHGRYTSPSPGHDPPPGAPIMGRMRVEAWLKEHGGAVESAPVDGDE